MVLVLIFFLVVIIVYSLKRHKDFLKKKKLPKENKRF